jgi:hypothetical protein
VRDARLHQHVAVEAPEAAVAADVVQVPPSPLFITPTGLPARATSRRCN